MNVKNTKGTKGVALVLLLIGFGLLGGGGAIHYFNVQQPLTWPRAEAVVVSSRVINPRNPNEHKPELVIRFQTGGASRQVTVTPSWSSGSYHIVKRHIDRYPAGSSVEVAINPADENDVRYVLGPTMTNLIGPGVFGMMGLCFLAIGVWTLSRSPARGRATQEESARGLRAATRVFGAIGVVVFAFGAWMVSRDVEMLRSWPAVDAEAIAVQGVSSRQSVGNRPSRLVYDVQVTFRFAVNGQQYESQAISGQATSSTIRRDELLAMFAPGTSHRIRHRPDDPNVIRCKLDWSFSTFLLSGGMVLMGLVFIGFALLFSRSLAKLPPQTRV